MIHIYDSYNNIEANRGKLALSSPVFIYSPYILQSIIHQYKFLLSETKILINNFELKSNLKLANSLFIFSFYTITI